MISVIAALVLGASFALSFPLFFVTLALLSSRARPWLRVGPQGAIAWVSVAWVIHIARLS